MRPVTLFVYGSLLVPRVLRALLDREPPLLPAYLPGHRRNALRGHDFPGIAPATGASTAGGLITVSTRELRCLDAWEDDFFCRRPVRVLLSDGSAVAAQAYLLAAQYRHLLGARAWRADDFARRRAPACANRARRWRRDRDLRLRHTSAN